MTRFSETRRTVAATFVALLLLAGSASAATIQYRGAQVSVPRGWSIVHLRPTTCVRFDRHAVYLGVPGANQACPIAALGRTEAILLEPAGAPRPHLTGAAAQFAEPGVTVTATWSRDRAAVERAVGRQLPRIDRSPRFRPARRAFLQPHAGVLFTGLGFDACSAPSLNALAAWGASPYRALGIYIGGTNAACSQTNLNAAWVYEASLAGWHLIPTYVGLQAPANSCGCAAISPSQASAQGTAAAQDAVAQMQGLGLGSGSPIYFDMEGYSSGSKSTPAVLAFLSAWTAALHAAGYLSGVYSSSNSGVVDLSGQYGTGYVEPDDIWIADWNGTQSTADGNAPAADWAAHQRIHQYRGGHNETYDSVTINVDSDYVDGATATGGLAPLQTSAPTLRIAPDQAGTVRLYPAWTGSTTTASWELLGGFSLTALAPIGTIPNGNAPGLGTHDAFPYYEVEAFDVSGNLLGTSPVVPMPPHLVVYGRTTYTPARGLGGVPVGCFIGTTCHISATLSAGRTTLASTTPESVASNGGGIVYFQLTPAARRRLAAARGKLPIKVVLRDSSGATASAAINLIQFTTTGPAPLRNLVNSAALRIVGATDFVAGGGVGGVLAACVGWSPCQATTTMSVGRTVVATTGTEFLGANSLGYLFFHLTPNGRKLLYGSKGNMLGVSVTISDYANPAAAAAGGGAGAGYGPSAIASGHIALVHAG